VALAQGAFFGIGAYTSAIMVMNGWPVWSGVVAGVVINIVLATAIAAPALRVRGEYLLLLSLGFAIVVYEVLLNWVSVTGGPMGISGIPSLGTFQPFGYEINFSRKTPNLWMVICAVMVGIGIAAILRNSYFGRTFRAVRDDPEAAAATGINVGMTLLLAFCISAVYASFSGSLYAHYLRILDPASFSAVLAIEILIMCVVGGRDSLLGPVIGAFLVVGLPELFRPLAEYRLVLFGACIVAILIFLPGGLASLLNRQIWAKWRGRGA
jgi:branched-chain amino acid transport system permease protein